MQTDKLGGVSRQSRQEKMVGWDWGGVVGSGEEEQILDTF